MRGVRRLFQSLLLHLYAGVQRTGAFSTPLGRRLFVFFYGTYKSWFEAGGIDCLEGFVEPGTVVLDVGANVGFFTFRFAAWVRNGGRVLAIEPESANADQLRRQIDAKGRDGIVEVIQAVASEVSGTLRLAVNPMHPGDHRIADEGVEVPSVTIDGLEESRGWPRVSLVKIDVQGAEQRVLWGAVETLSRFRPALYIELDDGCLRAMGASAEGLLAWLGQRAYRPRRLGRRDASPPLAAREVMTLCTDGEYAAFLFLCDGSVSEPAALPGATGEGHAQEHDQALPGEGPRARTCR